MRLTGWPATVALAAAVALGGCAAPSSEQQGAPPPEGTESGATQYFARAASGGAVYVPSPRSVRDATSVSDVVVKAAVSDVVATRSVAGENPSDTTQYYAWVLRDPEIVAGEIRQELQRPELLVEFAGEYAAERDPELLERLREDLPTDPGLWFLVWSGEFSEFAQRYMGDAAAKQSPHINPETYKLVHREGLVVVGPEGLVTPNVAAADRQRDRLAGDVARYQTLEALQAAVAGEGPG